MSCNEAKWQKYKLGMRSQSKGSLVWLFHSPTAFAYCQTSLWFVQLTVPHMEVPTDKNILEWDEGNVQAWLTSLGYPQYESQIRGDSSDLLQM